MAKYVYLYCLEDQLQVSARKLVIYIRRHSKYKIVPVLNSVPCREGIFGNGGIATRVSNHGTRRRCHTASADTLGKRKICCFQQSNMYLGHYADWAISYRSITYKHRKNVCYIQRYLCEFQYSTEQHVCLNKPDIHNVVHPLPALPSASFPVQYSSVIISLMLSKWGAIWQHCGIIQYCDSLHCEWLPAPRCHGELFVARLGVHNDLCLPLQEATCRHLIFFFCLRGSQCSRCPAVHGRCCHLHRQSQALGL